MDIGGFERRDFSDGGIVHPVYRIGSGPAVILMHELPGMSDQCVELARKLAGEGYRVAMPLLFGEPGMRNSLAPLLQPCVWREFQAMRARADRPITAWLRALAREERRAAGGKGVGAIGMCFTGSFALSLMLTPELIAPVCAQPSPPVWPWKSAELGLTDAELANARARSEKEGIPVLGLRFKGDSLCRRERFDALRAAFGERFRPVEVEGAGHSVLTYHFDRLSSADKSRVWRELTGFLKERLSSPR